MVVLGVLALFSLPAAGVLSVAFVALTLLAGGCAALIAVFKSDGLAEALVMIILTAMLLITGGALLVEPVRWMVNLTILIGTFLFLSGVARIIIALFNRQGRWGWRLLHGVVNVLLGWLIWIQWPLSGLVTIGLVVGIELILVGVTWIVGVRATQPQPQATRHKPSKKHASRRR
jgi:uncharacterized membrane protein HdeD (DUF308 family)